MWGTDYKKLINNIHHDFGKEGWGDGYADMPSSFEKIYNALKSEVSLSELVDYLYKYLAGYDIGCYMSEHADEIYDEDGNLKDEEYDMSSLIDIHDVINQIINIGVSPKEEAQLFLIENEDFYQMGYIDGYAGISSRLDEIISKLENFVSETELKLFTSKYIQGYQMGEKQNLLFNYEDDLDDDYVDDDLEDDDLEDDYVEEGQKTYRLTNLQ